MVSDSHAGQNRFALCWERSLTFLACATTNVRWGRAVNGWTEAKERAIGEAVVKVACCIVCVGVGRSWRGLAR